MFRLVAIAVALVATAAHAAGSRPDAAEKASDDRNKMICKRFAETGSLVRNYRTCKTKWEWERERENLRSFSTSDSCRLRADGSTC